MPLGGGAGAEEGDTLKWNFTMPERGGLFANKGEGLSLPSSSDLRWIKPAGSVLQSFRLSRQTKTLSYIHPFFHYSMKQAIKNPTTLMFLIRKHFSNTEGNPQLLILR